MEIYEICLEPFFLIFLIFFGWMEWNFHGLCSLDIHTRVCVCEETGQIFVVVVLEWRRR